jgi:hypothetical protein
VQHTFDLDRGDRGTLQAGQQNPAQRVAERHAEATLQRLGHEHGLAARVAATLRSSALGFFSSCQFFALTAILLPWQCGGPRPVPLEYRVGSRKRARG